MDEQKRYFYKQDPIYAICGLATVGEAHVARDTLRERHKEPEFRVRVRLRHTGLFDVVVKRRTELKEP